jgi:hypothetical protein
VKTDMGKTVPWYEVVGYASFWSPARFRANQRFARYTSK